MGKNAILHQKCEILTQIWHTKIYILTNIMN